MFGLLVSCFFLTARVFRLFEGCLGLRSGGFAEVKEWYSPMKDVKLPCAYSLGKGTQPDKVVVTSAMAIFVVRHHQILKQVQDDNDLQN